MVKIAQSFLDTLLLLRGKLAHHITRQLCKILGRALCPLQAHLAALSSINQVAHMRIKMKLHV